jgi:hypothetical protein
MVRGLEEDLRWRLTPEPDRAAMETDLVSVYIWQARTSAARHDGKGYDASMQRFFLWADRLKTDIGKAPPDQRSTSRSAIGADRSLVSSFSNSGPDQAQTRRAQSIIDDVQAESEAGGDGHHGSGNGGGGQDQKTSPTVAPTLGDDSGSPGGGPSSPTQLPDHGGDDGGHSTAGGS